MEKLERRAIGRVSFPSKGILVICDTQEAIHVNVRDLGPIGVGVRLEQDIPGLKGKDAILVAETLIMYADIVRQDPMPDGSWSIGLAARRFTPDVLKYLFESIEMKANSQEGN